MKSVFMGKMFELVVQKKKLQQCFETSPNRVWLQIKNGDTELFNNELMGKKSATADLQEMFLKTQGEYAEIVSNFRLEKNLDSPMTKAVLDACFSYHVQTCSTDEIQLAPNSGRKCCILRCANKEWTELLAVTYEGTDLLKDVIMKSVQKHFDTVLIAMRASASDSIKKELDKFKLKSEIVARDE